MSTARPLTSTDDWVNPDFPWPQVELIETDSEPLETDWHRVEINLLLDSLHAHLAPRKDYYAGGNMFVYFNVEQARNRDYRGPDFFFVEDVPFEPMRPYWAVWKEGGRYPDVIIELLSPTTAVEDRTTKKDLYERTFRTTEYFCYDPATQRLEGWRLNGGILYSPMTPDERGWLRSNRLNLWLGPWFGLHQKRQMTWLRFYHPDGSVVLLPAEAEQQRADREQLRAEVEKQRAEAEQERADGEKSRADGEKQRADALEAEVARLRAAAEIPAKRKRRKP